ncbi:helix-turn-helix domain containing protein [Anaerobacillus sp. MEB173]|uniref:helix-turn-helix domain containing protein n=1 Tax=Anaerobacillus sp. MEB173 TaxID=3383345 RepID=UPI003F8E2B15
MKVDNVYKQDRRVEKYYMVKKRTTIYTALEELDFHWDEREVAEFIRLWKRGLSLQKIANKFSRDIDEAAVLVLDLARKKRITPREFGVGGDRF